MVGASRALRRSAGGGSEGERRGSIPRANLMTIRQCTACGGYGGRYIKDKWVSCAPCGGSGFRHEEAKPASQDPFADEEP